MKQQRQRDVKSQAARNGGTEIRTWADGMSKVFPYSRHKPLFLLVILAQDYACWDLESSRHMFGFGLLGCPVALAVGRPQRLGIHTI